MWVPHVAVHLGSFSLLSGSSCVDIIGHFLTSFVHLITVMLWTFHAGESEQLELCAVVISPQPMIIIESGTKAQLKPSLSFHPHKYFEDCLLPASQHLTFFICFLHLFPYHLDSATTLV